MEGLLRKLELFGYAAPFLYATATYGFFSWLDKTHQMMDGGPHAAK